jgi:hypothetical protein
MPGLISLSFFAQSGHIDAFRSIVGEGTGMGIESAKLARVEPRAYLREATMRSVRNPGTVTLARDLKPRKPERNRFVDREHAISREWLSAYDYLAVS